MLKTGLHVYNKKAYMQVISNDLQSVYTTEIHQRAVYSKSYGWLPGGVVPCF